ncbi:MAG: hypothetical protein ACOX7K_03565 [Oscillospiraceae bacterium]|jgi:hypothetical protein
MGLFDKKEPWKSHRIEEENNQPKRLFRKKRNHKYFLVCKSVDVIGLFRDLLEIDSPLSTLEILYQGWVIGSDMDDQGRSFDIEFFLDDQKFDSMEAFLEGAGLRGARFSERTDNITVLEDIYFGNPHYYTLLEAPEICETPVI